VWISAKIICKMWFLFFAFLFHCCCSCSCCSSCCCCCWLVVLRLRNICGGRGKCMFR